MLCRCLLSSDLKPIIGPALFTFSGISFHLSTTLCEKNCLRTSSLAAFGLMFSGLFSEEDLGVTVVDAWAWAWA